MDGRGTVVDTPILLFKSVRAAPICLCLHISYKYAKPLPEKQFSVQTAIYELVSTMLLDLSSSTAD